MATAKLQVDTAAMARCRTAVAGAAHAVGGLPADLADATNQVSALGTLPDTQPVRGAVRDLQGALATQVSAAAWLLDRIQTTIGSHQTKADNAETQNVDQAARDAGTEETTSGHDGSR